MTKKPVRKYLIVGIIKNPIIRMIKNPIIRMIKYPITSIIAIAIIAILFIISNAFYHSNNSQINDCLLNPNLLDKTALENCKAREEFYKLHRENNSPLGLAFAPLIISFIAVVLPGLLAFFTMIGDRKDKRDKDIKEQELQRKEQEKQRDKEKLDKEIQFIENYDRAIANLGAESLEKRVNSASELLYILQPSILQPNHDKFCDILLVIVRFNLKKKIDDKIIQEILITVLESIIDFKLASRNKGESINPLVKLNLDRSALYKLSFKGVDFSDISVDIAYSYARNVNADNIKLPKLLGIGVCLEKASFVNADLQGARLNSSRCKKATFQKSNLISATFKHADLRYVDFSKAKLQSAHFENADLKGANFTEANLAGAYFKGADLPCVDFSKTKLRSAHFEKANLEGANFSKANLAGAYFIRAKLNDFALKSILKASKESWREAHFDTETKVRLDSLSKSSQ